MHELKNLQYFYSPPRKPKYDWLVNVLIGIALGAAITVAFYQV